jgi:hypothetical protein
MKASSGTITLMKEEMREQDFRVINIKSRPHVIETTWPFRTLCGQVVPLENTDRSDALQGATQLPVPHDEDECGNCRKSRRHMLDGRGH